jgi:hypothetical protein
VAGGANVPAGSERFAKLSIVPSANQGQSRATRRKIRFGQPDTRSRRGLRAARTTVRAICSGVSSVGPSSRTVGPAPPEEWPGITVTTRTPRCATSPRSACENACSAALDAP